MFFDVRFLSEKSDGVLILHMPMAINFQGFGDTLFSGVVAGYPRVCEDQRGFLHGYPTFQHPGDSYHGAQESRVDL